METNSKSFYIKNISFWVITSVISILLLRNFGMSNKQSLAFAILCILASFLHIHNSKNKENYIKGLLCLTVDSNRKYEFDHLRFLAVALVIITHSLQVDIASGVVSQPGQIYVFTCIYILALSCNLIYVMISGALLLPFKEEKLSDFYIYRLSKVIIPMLIYYVWYLWQNSVLHDVTVGGELYKFYTGMITISPHYWLLLIIISLYIVYPFIRYMLKDMPYNYLTAIVVIALIFMGIVVFSKEPCYMTCFFADWIGVAIIGYWLTRDETRKFYPFICILGFVSAVIICILIKNVEDYLQMVTNCSPLMVMFSMGIVAFIMGARSVFSRGNYLLRLLSRYSYAIILIHWWTLHWITIGRLHLATNWLGGVGIFTTLAATLFVSLVVAFIVDNVVVVLVLWCFNNVAAGIKKIIKK